MEINSRCCAACFTYLFIYLFLNDQVGVLEENNQESVLSSTC